MSNPKIGKLRFKRRGRGDAPGSRPAGQDAGGLVVKRPKMEPVMILFSWVWNSSMVVKPLALEEPKLRTR